jgi:hypothetical protein
MRQALRLALVLAFLALPSGASSSSFAFSMSVIQRVYGTTPKAYRRQLGR